MFMPKISIKLKLFINNSCFSIMFMCRNYYTYNIHTYICSNCMCVHDYISNVTIRVVYTCVSLTEQVTVYKLLSKGSKNKKLLLLVWLSFR